MRQALSILRTRAALLLGLAALGLVQTGCAHPVWVEPSVQVRMDGPVYGQVYGTSPGVVFGGAYGSVYGSVYSPPVVVPAAPAWGASVLIVPRVVVPEPVHRPGWGHRGGWHPRGHHHGHWR